MRLPVYIAAILILSSARCSTTADSGVVPTSNVQEKAVVLEKMQEAPDTVVVQLGVDHLPFINGGMNSIRKKLTYPKDAREAGIEGRVFVKFIVDEKGHPQQVEIYKGLCTSCDAEAIRLIEETRFIPGYIIRSGTKIPVAMPMSLPIEFKLPPK